MLNTEQEIENLKGIADKALIDFKKIMEYLNNNDDSLEDDSQKGGEES